MGSIQSATHESPDPTLATADSSEGDERPVDGVIADGPRAMTAGNKPSEPIRVLIDNGKHPSWIRRVLAHPLMVVVAGGVVGGVLTDYYARRQKENDYRRTEQQSRLASERSFRDESNKVRIQKIGEMWEKIDTNEVAIDTLLVSANRSNPNRNKAEIIKQIENLIQDDRLNIARNSYWLGARNYEKISQYFDKNVKLTLNALLAKPGTDVTDILAERQQAKQDIIQTRNSMLIEDDSIK
jgi:hypothetical protein